MKLIVMLLVVAILSSGCVPNGCAGWKPIILDGVSVDYLTDRDADDILAHNLFGQKQGCW
jgi:hypothetical protein